MSASWKVTLPCTRAEAEAFDVDLTPLALIDPVPSFLAQKIKPFDPDCWEMCGYFAFKPGVEQVALFQSLLPSAKGAKPVIEHLPDSDWVTLSQEAIAPVQAGRFYVHTSTNRAAAYPGSVYLEIDAGQAFGTGSHETTTACLKMLDGLKRSGRRYRNIADIGTGTGLLAFAASHLWPSAFITASDIDPKSIEITGENAIKNGLRLGPMAGAIEACVAAGTDHRMIQRRAPYDLIMANILAGPLIELAPSLSAVLEEGGTLILAGLLNTQAEAVARAYRSQGLALINRHDEGDWPCLRFFKRRRSGWQRPRRAQHPIPPTDNAFGTW